MCLLDSRAVAVRGVCLLNSIDIISIAYIYILTVLVRSDTLCTTWLSWKAIYPSVAIFALRPSNTPLLQGSELLHEARGLFVDRPGGIVTSGRGDAASMKVSAYFRAVGLCLGASATGQRKAHDS